MPKKDFGPFDTRGEVLAHIVRSIRARTPEQRRANTEALRKRYFERLDARTRRILEAAEDEALELDADLMDTGHLLAGLLVVSPMDGLSLDDVKPRLARGFTDEDAAALATLGISLADIVERAEETFGPGALRRNDARPQMYRVQPSFEFVTTVTAAGSDARSIRNIHPDHLFAALIDPSVNAGTTRASAILHAVGFDTGRALRSLRERLGPPSERAFFEGRGIPGAVMRFARRTAEREGQTERT